jgi:hypothetical protein
MLEIEFDPDDWRTITDYLSEWDDWRKEESIGRPDFTNSSIFLVPLTISLFKSEKRLEKLTLALTVLTTILTVLTIVNVLILLNSL